MPCRARPRWAAAVIAVDPLAVQTRLRGQARCHPRFRPIDEAARIRPPITNGQGANSAIVTIDVVTGEHVSQAFDAIGQRVATVVVTGMASGKELLASR